MVSVIFLPVADAEATEAHDWYEKESPGLGLRFRMELDVAVARIGENPLVYPVLHRDVRRALLRRFPYELFFLLRPEAGLCHRVLSRQPRSTSVAAAGFLTHRSTAIQRRRNEPPRARASNALAAVVLGADSVIVR
jgi:hypothetical protein